VKGVEWGIRLVVYCVYDLKDTVVLSAFVLLLIKTRVGHHVEWEFICTKMV
jgi:hypothetical protein